jgi:hypothetical protein
MRGRAGRGLIAALAVMVAAAIPLPAAAQNGLDSLEQAALALKPGQYLWRDLNPGAGGKVSVVVSLPLQVVYAFRGDDLVGVAAASTGKVGKVTPTGKFTVLQKRVFHRSNLYSNAPMPYMQRLTWDGIAIHAGHNPGYPASHGCIRLPDGFAQLLFNATALGAPVAVVNGEWSVPQRPDEFPMIIAEADGRAASRFANVTFNPQPAPRQGEHGAALQPAVVRGDEWIVPDVELIVPDRRHG